MTWNRFGKKPNDEFPYFDSALKVPFKMTEACAEEAAAEARTRDKEVTTTTTVVAEEDTTREEVAKV